LSPTEKQIVLKLSNFDQPVSREDLKASLELSSTDFINGLESLQQRYLVTKIKDDQILFKLSTVF
ncbi:MAG TPA: ATPase domain-containing protein, partial [Cyanobacteria bacterium UBA11166]|nr:ATPase domain-containing protein [Cyanobacteria bacterium UBA11166]